MRHHLFMHLTHLSSYLTLCTHIFYANCTNWAINLVWAGECFICWGALHKLLKTIAIYIIPLKNLEIKNLYFVILFYLFLLKIYYQSLMYIEQFYCKYLNGKCFNRFFLFFFLFPFFIRGKNFQEIWLLYCLPPLDFRRVLPILEESSSWFLIDFFLWIIILTLMLTVQCLPTARFLSLVTLIFLIYLVLVFYPQKKIHEPHLG